MHKAVFKTITTSILLIFIATGVLFAGGSDEGAERVTLRINTWENPATTEAVEEINRRFTEEYPNISVEFTHSPTANFNQENPARVAAGDVDIWSDFGFAFKLQDFHTGVDLASIYQNIEAGLVEPLDGQAFLNNYKDEAITDAMTYKGKVYGVCVGSVVYSGYYYNKAIFEQLNLDVPQTYDELIEVSEAIQSSGVSPFTAAGAPIWPINMMVHGFLGPLFDDIAAFEEELWTGGQGFENPKYVEALEKYQRLMVNYYEKGFQAIDYNPHIGRFIAGKAAMLPDGSWQAASIADAGGEDFAFGYAPIPSSDDAEDNQAFFGKYDLMWQVHAKSQKKEAAMLWLDFFSRKENYSYFINTVGWLPTQDGIEVENEVVAEIAELPMKLSFEQIHVSRYGQGQYANGLPQHLVPVGTVETVEEFVALARADWEAVGK